MANSKPRGYPNEIMMVISMVISGTDLLELPTIYKAYVLGPCKGISLQNMAQNIVQ